MNVNLKVANEVVKSVEILFAEENNQDQEKVVEKISALIKECKDKFILCHGEKAQDVNLSQKCLKLSHTLFSIDREEGFAMALVLRKVAAKLKPDGVIADPNELTQAIDTLIKCGPKTIETISYLIKTEIRSILCKTETTEAAALQKKLLDLSDELVKFKLKEANALAFKVMGLAQGLCSGAKSNDWTSLAPELWVKILDQVPETNDFEDDTFNLFSELKNYAYASSQFKELALLAKIKWANRENISIKTFGCSNFEEALAFLSDHPALTVANLGDICDVTQEQLNELFEKCPQIKSLIIRITDRIAIPEKAAKLQYLDCDNCKISNMPESFPLLGTFICSWGRLPKIPSAPGLRDLDCENCHFENPLLPTFPELFYLNCLDSNIATLSAESLPKLESLICSGLQITLLPTFPKLKHLIGSKLQNLPPLPKLQSLECSLCHFNEVKDLPELRFLVCKYCENLEDISALTKLVAICYEDCPKLILPTAEGVSIKKL